MSEKTYRYLRCRTEQGVLVLTITEPRVQGDDVAETLRQEMLAAVDESGSSKVVIDFRHAEYISSAAFRPLLALRRKLQETGGRIMLCGLSETVGDVFYTTRMISDGGTVSPLFEMEPDEAAAIARLTRA
ncbi:MAG TPA: STAS domain-containing protein [Gemmataceae bacterium]|jgi:anti-anti-sigma factor|nr:STAS domain-containing protein [Gemmataceae bacterium]